MRMSAKKPVVERRPGHQVFIYLAAWFAVISWGGSFAAARFLLHPATAGLISLSPVMLAALRFSIAALFFLVPLVRAVMRGQVAGRDLPFLGLLGLLSIALYFWLQYVGVQQTSASVASILVVGLIPGATALLAQTLREERFNAMRGGALLLGFVGVALIALQQPPSLTLQSGFLFGVLCLVGNAFLFAVYSNLSKRWMRNSSAVVITGGTMVSGAAGLVLFSLLDPANNQWGEVIRLDGLQWAALLYLAIVCSVLAYLAYNVALSKMDASRVAVYIYFEPVVAILLGVTLLGEQLNWQVIAGGVAIGASVMLVNLVRK